jgi:hypothetical protein
MTGKSKSDDKTSKDEHKLRLQYSNTFRSVINDAKQNLKQNKVLKLIDEDFREIATFQEFKNVVQNAGLTLNDEQEKILNDDDRFNSSRSNINRTYADKLTFKLLGYVSIFGLVCGFIYLLYEYNTKQSTAQ